MKKSVKIIISVLLAAVIAAAVFFGGYLTGKLTRNAAVSSYEWFINTVDKYYYFGGAEQGYSDEGLSAIADKYLDRYSEYYTAEEYQDLLLSNSGSKSGIGISYSFVSGKGVYVASVTGNSPAYISGLRAGEWLESGGVNGEEVTFDSSADFKNLIDSAEENRDITLTAADGTEYVVYKSQFTASYAYLCTNETAWVFKDSVDGGLALYEEPKEKISELPDGAAYINLSQFYGTAAAEFYRLAEKFNAYNCTSLILDLRSNGGGYVKVMQDIAGSFAGGAVKPAMYSSDKNGGEDRYDCAEVADAEYRIPESAEVYVLANSGTASASEALIGAMICYGVLDYENIFLSDYSEEYIAWLEATEQEVKTGRTYGKGIMQSTFVNNLTGEALKLTTAKIFWPDGETCIHDRGVTADDGCTLVKAAWQHTKGDEELKEVLGIIKSR